MIIVALPNEEFFGLWVVKKCSTRLIWDEGCCAIKKLTLKILKSWKRRRHSLKQPFPNISCFIKTTRRKNSVPIPGTDIQAVYALAESSLWQPNLLKLDRSQSLIKYFFKFQSNISAVLDAITDGRKANCFEASDGAFCGNKIVEEGEECDCGFDDQECQEECCYPRQSGLLSPEEAKAKRCTRKPGTQCSPSEGPCCDKSCSFTSKLDNIRCKNEDDCTRAAFCNGKAATCPEPSHKPDNVTECNQGTQVKLVLHYFI